jgi:hypothetical protein
MQKVKRSVKRVSVGTGGESESGAESDGRRFSSGSETTRSIEDASR